MKYAFLCIVFLITCAGVSQKGFQQKVDYTIQADYLLDQKAIKVQADIVYQNASPDTLTYILWHLWANAFSHKGSAFALQQLEMGLYDFHFADETDLGGYSSVIFQHDGQELETTSYLPVDFGNEVYRTNLPEGLAPGDSVRISCEYILTLPRAFSRIGRSVDFISLTQWYPKPVVYSQNKWHPMAYLDIGEFYAEYGDYKVELNVPSNLVVAGTGLQTVQPSERPNFKKHIFRANQVHDMAFFMSPDFNIEKDTVWSDRRPVPVLIYRVNDAPAWDHAMSIIKRAIHFYIEEVGTYHYPQLSIVQGPGSDGSGMEYPMISIIHESESPVALEEVIVHEVGHNWFYGMLANNERKYPWMDEGLTRFYDLKYKARFDTLEMLYTGGEGILAFRDSGMPFIRKAVLMLDRLGKNLPINAHSEDSDALRYMLTMYEKAPWAIEYLEEYIGAGRFKECMRSYFDIWKFHHPEPRDLIAHFSECADRDLSWFSDHFLASADDLDLSINLYNSADGSEGLAVRSENGKAIPFKITFFNGDSAISDQWYAASELGVPQEVNSEQWTHTSVCMDPPIFDVNTRNNYLYKTKKRPFRLRFIDGIEDAQTTQVAVAPVLGYNAYDGFMAGIAMHSGLFPQKRLRYFVSPCYAVGSRDISGILAIEKDVVLRKGNLRKLTYSVMGKRFRYDANNDLGLKRRYDLFVPGLTMHWGYDTRSFSALAYKPRLALIQKALFTSPDQFDVTTDLHIMHQLIFDRRWKKRLTRNHLKSKLEFEVYDNAVGDEASYLKASTSLDTRFRYSKDGQFFLRIFGAYFLHNTQRQSASFANALTRGSISLTSQGFSDYDYDDYFLGRTDQDGFLSRQIYMNDGGFKNALGSPYNVGLSNDLALSVNTKIDLPLKIPGILNFRPYMDVAYYTSKSVSSQGLEGKFSFSGGLAIEIGRDIMGIYIPLLHSSDLNDAYAGQSLFNRIAWMINFNKLNLWDFQDKLEFE